MEGITGKAQEAANHCKDPGPRHPTAALDSRTFALVLYTKRSHVHWAFIEKVAVPNLSFCLVLIGREGVINFANGGVPLGC